MPCSVASGIIMRQLRRPEHLRSRWPRTSAAHPTLPWSSRIHRPNLIRPYLAEVINTTWSRPGHDALKFSHWQYSRDTSTPTHTHTDQQLEGTHRVRTHAVLSLTLTLTLTFDLWPFNPKPHHLRDIYPLYQVWLWTLSDHLFLNYEFNKKLTRTNKQTNGPEHPTHTAGKVTIPPGVSFVNHLHHV